MQEVRVYSHKGPIRCRKRGYRNIEPEHPHPCSIIITPLSSLSIEPEHPHPRAHSSHRPTRSESSDPGARQDCAHTAGRSNIASFYPLSITPRSLHITLAPLASPLTPLLISLHFTGPPVPITARVHLTP
eukprot:1191618-Prorocentrum_minimum.AAC.6